MYDLDASCQGFTFQAFVPNKRGRPVPAPPEFDTRGVEDVFFEKVNWMLRGRPDLLDMLGCIEGGLEVRLHCGTGFYGEGEQVYFYGRVYEEDDQLVMEVATDEVLEGGRDGHDVLDVVIHELTHVLDMARDDEPGQLPLWSAEQRALFVALREAEKPSIAAGTSAIDEYALTSDMEFLAVAVETFFVLPAELARTSPGLHAFFTDYFAVEGQHAAATLAMLHPVVV